MHCDWSVFKGHNLDIFSSFAHECESSEHLLFLFLLLFYWPEQNNFNKSWKWAYRDFCFYRTEIKLQKKKNCLLYTKKCVCVCVYCMWVTVTLNGSVKSVKCLPCISKLKRLQICACLAVCTVYVNSPDSSPLSHSILPVLFLPNWSFQLYKIYLYESLPSLPRCFNSAVEILWFHWNILCMCFIFFFFFSWNILTVPQKYCGW